MEMFCGVNQPPCHEVSRRTLKRSGLNATAGHRETQEISAPKLKSATCNRRMKNTGDTQFDSICMPRERGSGDAFRIDPVPCHEDPREKVTHMSRADVCGDDA